MKPVFALLILGAVLFSACNLPGGSESSSPTSPISAQPAVPGVTVPVVSTPASVIYLPQQMREGPVVESAPPVTYFWLDGASQGLAVIVDKSYVDNSGFSLELERPGVSLVLMGGDIATAAWNAAVENGTPIVVRGQAGYVFTPPSGVSLHWFENDNYYLASAMGLSVDEVQALLNSLETLNQSDLQARLSQ